MNIRLLAAALLLVAAGCSQDALLQKFASAEDQAVAKKYADYLRAEQFAEIEAVADPTIKSAGLRDTLKRMADLIPDSEPKAIKLVGANTMQGPNVLTDIHWISTQYLRYAGSMSRVRYRYVPEESGWIGISNPWGVLAYVDCRQGGAQRAFTELCQNFERAGWRLEGRKFDWQFVSKGTLRWEIRIGVLAPGEKMRKGWGDPMPGLAPVSSSAPTR